MTPIILQVCDTAATENCVTIETNHVNMTKDDRSARRASRSTCTQMISTICYRPVFYLSTLP